MQSTRAPFRVLVPLVLLVALTIPVSLHAETLYYLTGDPADQANKAAATPGTATFGTTAPTSAVPIVQTSSPLTNADFVANPLGASWTGAFSGTLSGVLDLRWYWSTANPATIALGCDVESPSSPIPTSPPKPIRSSRAASSDARPCRSPASPRPRRSCRT